MKIIETNHTSHGTISSTKEKFGDLHSKLRAFLLLHRVYDIFLWIWCLFAWVFLSRSSYHTKLAVRTNAFSKMDKLRLLQLHYVQLHGSYEHFPTGLRWLSMHGFPLSHVPLDMQMENMVALDMSHSNLRHLWKKPKLLRSLKFLILRYCHALVSVGRFDGFPQLERLILSGCVSLVEVCESIGNCDRLFLLDVSGCTKLKKLPRSIGELKNLRTLLIDGCSNLSVFPVEAIPRGFGSSTISLPSSLVRLSLGNNNLSNESFPTDFGSLSMLEELSLDQNPIDYLPECVRSLSRLEFLSLGGCRRLKTVSCAPSTLKHLRTTTCVSLEKITFHSEMSTPPYIEYEDYLPLSEIEGIFKMQAIAEIDEEILCSLGWINIKQHMKDQKLPMKNYYTWICCYQRINREIHPVVLPVQMLFEHGIFSTFFQGNCLPDWMTHISCSPVLYLTMPSSGKSCTIRGLNLCIVTSISSTQHAPYPMVKLRNLTKGYMWIYNPQRCATPEANEEGIVWLSHWLFWNNEFEDGDEVVVEAFDGDKKDGVVEHFKACGVSVVYDDGNEKLDPLAYYKSWNRIIVNDRTLRGGCLYYCSLQKV